MLTIFRSAILGGHGDVAFVRNKFTDSKTVVGGPVSRTDRNAPLACPNLKNLKNKVKINASRKNGEKQPREHGENSKTQKKKKRYPMVTSRECSKTCFFDRCDGIVHQLRSKMKTKKSKKKGQTLDPQGRTPPFIQVSSFCRGS